MSALKRRKVRSPLLGYLPPLKFETRSLSEIDFYKRRINRLDTSSRL